MFTSVLFVDAAARIGYTLFMKRVFILVLLCILPIRALSHPGKTDHAGGHKCLRDCEKWGLFYGEYHEHDTEGKVIRIRTAPQKKSRLRTAVISEVAGTVIPAKEEINAPKMVAAQAPSNAYEKEVLADPLVFGVLALLILLLFVQRRRGKR